MSRRFLLIAAASFALAQPLPAQEVPPAVENSKNAAIGEISGDTVYVRSGAGDNYYPTMKLEPGSKVTVVGERFDWLKVVPPEGSFCYIAKAFVDAAPGAKTGTVNRPDVNVRAGSALNSMKTTVQAKLAQGQTVQILGEQDEYFKIAPPADAFVYVKKESVKPVQALPQVAGNGNAAPQAPGNVPQPQEPGATGTSPAITETPTLVEGATTRPADAVAGGATTQPAVAAAEQRFDALEAKFNTESAKTIENQPVAELLSSYEKLIANAQLPESMRRIADFRVQTLKARAEAREQFLEVARQQEEARKRTQTLKAEQEELAQQIKKNEVKIFTAVGELRPSSLQAGPQLLYRLTDPSSGYTVCYLRSDEAKVAGMISKFVGVNGEISTEPGLNLRIVTASEVEEVDPNKVFRGIASEIVPPSLLPQAAPDAQAASSTGQE